jgi:O-methyltransferase involved in polyketide biosynthesis
MDLTDLVYDGERGSLANYLTTRGWEVTAHSLAEAYAANGFELPDDEMFAAFADARTISGVLVMVPSSL